ncbi:unnamed protein product [Caenorhabditis auriculariae]|uniref:BED-type domain-containing protein n=1 Tax=Caenorhabditis auriculariae TaxID=2777116 RepID=A0A8S1GSJ5_9PELO|nr:unnamed protein product [Caenorhabditis auriculariae]
MISGDHLVRSYSSSPSSCDHSGGVYEESHPTATNAFVAAENRQISLNFFADNNLLCEHLNDESSAATTTSETTTTASSESPEPEPTTIDAIMTSSSTMTTDEVPTTTTTTTSPPSTPSELFDAIQRFQEQQQQRHIALFNSLAQNIGADPVTSPPSLLNFGLPLAGAAADLSTFAGDSGSSTKGVTPKRETSNPPYSPWMRNAGRKKSHPVWEFFRDLKDTQGTGGVMCLHCAWQGDDRSPNNLRTHLKKFHTDDGIFQRFSFRLSQDKN